MEKIVIVAAKRTPIGRFGGGLAGVAPGELGRVAANACFEQVGRTLDVDEVIVGNVLAAGHGMNVARQVSIRSGLPVSVPAFTVNKVCGSGLKAVTLAAQSIALGEQRCVLAGGVESMSQAGHVSLGARWGARLGHAVLHDLILQDGLTDAFHSCHMGVTAENIAEELGISREEQDQFAYESQQKAARAIEQGWFRDEIVPVPVTGKKGATHLFEVDEHPRADTTIEGLAKLSPAFRTPGTVTAGNASGINDGAAMLLVASESYARENGIPPLAEIIGWGSGAVKPEIMGLGPVEAVQKALGRAKLAIDDLELVESNEAFAAQSLGVNRKLGWDPARLNVCGGAIALGHPIGASGARILVTLLHQLRRLRRQVGLATLCVGGGQGIAIVIRALPV